MYTKAIIFDLYGVMGLNAWQRFKTEHFGSDPSAWLKLRQLGQAVDAGKASNGVFVKAVAKAAGVSTAEVRRQFEDTLPNEPLLEWADKRLRGLYKIGLLSNASRDVMHTIFTPEQRSLFDAAITSFHVGLTKPNPAIYSRVCDELGVDPAECIMIDDQPRHLASAEKLGMKVVLYDSVPQVIRDVEGLIST